MGNIYEVTLLLYRVYFLVLYQSINDPEVSQQQLRQTILPNVICYYTKI